jgi:hypothetical protein
MGFLVDKEWHVDGNSQVPVRIIPSSQSAAPLSNILNKESKVTIL